MPEVQFDVTVAGKAVHFRERLPAKQSANLLRVFQDTTSDDANTLIAFLVRVIDQWGFEGDPTEAKSYEDLDLLDELIPLSAAASTYMGQRMARLADVKN